MKKFLWAIPIVLIGAYLLGPKPNYPSYDGTLQPLNVALSKLDEYVVQKELKIDAIPENKSKIVWNNGVEKTPYSIVYLHGFSASPYEAEPLHRDFAKRYGANLYLHRIARHGIKDRELFKELTPKEMVDSAKEALAIGQLLGEKVIVMSTSTGSTLAMYLSALNPEAIHAHIMYSPNFDLYDANSKLAMKPWGLNLLKQLIGEYRSPKFPPAAKPYWTDEYRIEGLLALIYMVNETMTDENFKKIKVPYFIGYYYKNEEEQDKIISTKRIQEFNELTQTPESQKRLMPFPNVNAHVVCSPFMSQDLETVRKETFKFAEEILNLNVVQ